MTHQPSSEAGSIAYLHAYAGLTEEQLLERREYFTELYYQTLNQLEAIEVARDGISQLIRERRQAAREAESEAL